MAQDQVLDTKLEAFFDKLDRRLESMENKLDSRLSKVEDKCNKLDRKSKKQEKDHKEVASEVSKLKISVAVLEQEKLERNVIIKGIPESENEDNDSLSNIVEDVFCLLDADFESQFLIRVRRIGTKNIKNKSRLIVAELANDAIKLKIMKGLADKNLNCSRFKYADGNAWGSNEDKIFLSDQLTSTMSHIFYHARQLRKQKQIKYAWTKLGRVYVKKDDDSRAFNIKSIEQLTDFKHKLITGDQQSDGDDSDESDSNNQDTEMETESEAASEVAPGAALDVASEAGSKKSTDSKRPRSPERKTTKKSPRPKRNKK